MQPLDTPPKLNTPLKTVLRTTQFHLRRLEELGINTIRDFLLYFPRRYTDSRNIERIADLQINTHAVIRGRITTVSSAPSWRRRMPVTRAIVSDKSGNIEVVWFNQPYLTKMLKPGLEIMLSGKVKPDKKKNKIIMSSPEIEVVRSEQVHTARIVPVYHETELGAAKRVRGKISSKWIREKIFPLMPFAEYFPEFMPEEILKAYKLMSEAEAVRNAHFPESEKKLGAAKRRLAFDELFLLQLAALHRRYMWRKIAEEEKKQIPPDWELIKKFTGSLPWKLTNAQRKAIYEIIKDIAKPFPMSRLLEGDTGSGKTVVAASCALHVIKAGFQSCVLAPTEILAQQHAKTFEKTLEFFEIKPVLLLGSTPEKEKRIIRERLKSGEIKFIIGTHALLQEKIKFKSLGLATIDEQHRFGVKQREFLKTHGSPHVLSLTATPIPRTLALTVYGDQDLSVLDEMPAGRQKIITRIVPEKKRGDSYKWIADEVKKGKQVFVIFPLIEESERLAVKAAVREWQRLNDEIFPHLRVALLHGQMKTDEKDRIMKNFVAGKSDILVSTAVVEVGIDVPNATIMVIEGAERFGLAQLHQFRGRVGRGSEQSYCFLFPTNYSPQNLKRLQALVKYSSGFKLAEIDLQMRGPGEVYGVSQSGIPDLKMANLSDMRTICLARETAEKLIEHDPEFKKYPKLKEKIAEYKNIAVE